SRSQPTMTLSNKIRMLFVLGIGSSVPMGVVAAFNFGFAYLLFVGSVFLSFATLLWGKSVLEKLCSILLMALFLYPTVVCISLCAEEGRAALLAALLQVACMTVTLSVGVPTLNELEKELRRSMSD
ncbi:MAG TPA: hypothetical protein VFA15_06105, partial [Nitrososphaera sp.]|nr:hypothetical protein [Nitrososphaera sp.]